MQIGAPFAWTPDSAIADPCKREHVQTSDSIVGSQLKSKLERRQAQFKNKFHAACWPHGHLETTSAWVH